MAFIMCTSRLDNFDQIKSTFTLNFPAKRQVVKIKYRQRNGKLGQLVP